MMRMNSYMAGVSPLAVVSTTLWKRRQGGVCQNPLGAMDPFAAAASTRYTRVITCRAKFIFDSVKM